MVSQLLRSLPLLFSWPINPRSRASVVALASGPRPLSVLGSLGLGVILIVPEAC